MSKLFAKLLIMLEPST